MQNFNTDAVAPKELTEAITIGWEYAPATQIVLNDAEGNPIPAVYQLKGTMSTNDLINLTGRFGTDGLTGLTEKMEANQLETIVEMVGAIYGDELVLQLANNPTIT